MGLLGTALGGLYGGLQSPQDYYNQLVQQQQAQIRYNIANAYSSTGGTLTVSPNITVESPWVSAPSRPQTAVEWLDRRVEEMRVRL